MTAKEAIEIVRQDYPDFELFNGMEIDIEKVVAYPSKDSDGRELMVFQYGKYLQARIYPKRYFDENDIRD